MSRSRIDRPADEAASLVELTNPASGSATERPISGQGKESNPGGMAREDEGDPRRVRVELIDQLYRQMTIGIVATLVNSSILAFILWNLIVHRILLWWLGASVAVTGLRYGLLSAYRTAALNRRQTQWWGKLQVAGFAVSGLVWGSAAIFLFPPQSTAHQAFIAFVLAGMVAGAVGMCSSVFPAFIAFSLPALAPICIQFLRMGDELHMAMGVMTLLFLILTVLTAWRINVAATELVALKEHFAEKVAARTDELIRANEELNREINDRKQAEEHLRESEQRIRMVIEHAQVVLWALDQRGIFTVSEGRGLATLGLQPGELTGRSLFDVYADYPQIIADARQALKGKSVSSVTEVQGIIFENRYVPLTDDQGAVSGAIGVAIDITAREAAESRIRLALREKEVLLKEIHHRVKNNLAVIISILKMRASRIVDPSGQEALEDCCERVEAMGLIHETLYRSENLAAIPLASYARNLSNNLMQMMLVKEERSSIQVVIEAEGIHLPIDEAMPCGLILNELLTNALKYAFAGRDAGQILISAQISDAGVFQLLFRDNGVGFPSGLDLEKCSTLGFRIISVLVKHQMEGAWEARNENGAFISIRWPIPAKTGTYGQIQA